MKTILRSIGNSKGIVIPSVLIKELGINIGDALNVSGGDGKIEIIPVKQRPQYKLSDLIAKCEPSAPIPECVSDWDLSLPVGAEL